MIDDQLSMSNTTQKDIQKAKTFLKFVELLGSICFRSRNVAIPHAAHLHEYLQSKLKWLPDPTLTLDKGNYKTFQELYGHDTKDTDCPSMAICRENHHLYSQLQRFGEWPNFWPVINLGVYTVTSNQSTRKMKILSFLL